MNETQTRIELPNAESSQQPGALVANGEGEAQCPIVPLVRFTLRRVKLLDIDAKYGSIKDLLDGLQYAGLIHGDREGEIRLEVNQQKVAHYKDEKTIIEVES